MKTFKLDHNGDVVITNGKIELVEGVELVVQTLRQVLATNLGEWFGDKEEGIDFYAILTKNPNYDIVQDTINTAVRKVADGLGVELTTSGFVFEKHNRNLHISFKLTLDNAESANVEVTL